MKNISKERKRFVLAYELGHFMLHMAPLKDLNNFDPINTTIFDNQDNWNHREIEANNFAAQLLMPRHQIGVEIKRLIAANANIKKDELVEELARVFEVPLTIMNLRLINLLV